MMIEIRRIGFLADTHSRKADGSDLPQQALDAFAGVDLIVHLGDIGQKGILERLGRVAPVLVPAGANKGYIPVGGAGPVKVIEGGGLSVGLTFNITLPRKDIVVEKDGSLKFPEKPLSDILHSKFARMVDAVAYGGTHRQTQLEYQGVLFFNPGSPTLPSDRRSDNDLGGVAVLHLTDGKPRVELVRLNK
jgi:putative phosphoesterase